MVGQDVPRKRKIRHISDGDVVDHGTLRQLKGKKHAALNALDVMRWIIRANLYDFSKLNLPLIIIIGKKRRIFVKENQIASCLR